MSIGVAIGQLASTMANYRFAYLLTVTNDGRAHAVAVTPSVSGDTLLLEGAGTKSRANAAQRPSVSLVWPPAQADDYTLIVDGQSSESGDGLAISPTRAVLHRPHAGGPGSPTGCDSDCVPIGAVTQTTRGSSERPDGCPPVTQQPKPTAHPPAKY